MAVNEELLKKVLEEIRPNLQADGGDREYVGVDDEGVVKLELQGACAGCPMSESCGRYTPHRRYVQICGCERKARGRICM